MDGLSAERTAGAGVSTPPRLLFLLVFLVVLLVLIIPPQVKPAITEDVRRAYHAVQQARDGGLLYIGLDYGAPQAGELETQAVAVFRHAVGRGLRVIVVGTKTAVNGFIRRVGRVGGPDEVGRYGPGYVILARRGGAGEAVENSGHPAADLNNLWAVSGGVDAEGRVLEESPALRGFSGPSQFELAAVFTSDGTGVPEPGLTSRYLSLFEPMGKPLVAGFSGIGAATAATYRERLAGVLIGYRGAAGYEQLSGAPGAGLRAANVVTVGALLLVGLVLLTFVVGYCRRVAERLSSVRRRRTEALPARERR